MVARYSPGTPVTERGKTIRRRHRKHRLSRTVLVLALTGLGVCLFVTLRNDYRLRGGVLKQMQEHANQLQQALNRLGKLPPPLIDIASRPPATRTPPGYADDMTRRYAADSIIPIIVAWSAVHRSVLLANGRAVTVCQDKKLSVEWVKESDFQQRLREQRSIIEAARTTAPSDAFP